MLKLFAALLRNVLRLLLPVAVASTVYLYLYPVFLGCAFPAPAASPALAFQDTLRQHIPLPTPIADILPPSAQVAPFRLLALGDPQLEGDSSIKNYGQDPFPHLFAAIRHFSGESKLKSRRKQIRQAFHDLVDVCFEDLPDWAISLRKRIDLLGNDFYLGHIYRTLMWWTRPSHVTVLGDLLGSQWVTDEEFDRRSARFWDRVFDGAERIPDEVAAYPSSQYHLAGYLGLDYDDPVAATWRRRLINIAGNHDVGYAGDLTVERLARFERAFGKAAYELRFELPVTDSSLNATIYNPETNPESTRLPPELRIVVVNDMILDTPAYEQSLQDATYTFVNDVINTASSVEYQGHFTAVLTHIPLYKPEGICVDSPYFSFHDNGGGVKEQNLLSADASRGFLEGIFGLNGDPRAPGGGLGRPGVILNGHDHEGYDTYHYIDQTEAEDSRGWRASRWVNTTTTGDNMVVPGGPDIAGLREITVRSMMGEFGGNAGLLSAWFDEDAWEWQFEFATCPLGRQHWWWAVHVVDIIAVVLTAVYAVVSIINAVMSAVGLGDGSSPTTGKPVSSSATSKAAPKSVEQPIKPLAAKEKALSTDGSQKPASG